LLFLGPSDANYLPESQYRPYEVANIREKLRQALDELEKNGSRPRMEPVQQSQRLSDAFVKPNDFDNRRSTITKNQLSLVIYNCFNLYSFFLDRKGDACTNVWLDLNDANLEPAVLELCQSSSVSLLS
jgi:hypothetical protein